ncbi:MAG: UDP-N-acetylglucosamine--N-acetylmuramyl-(pentapeptide) pyrophosphoryl-undecaprenol N-acetylglucosamine transferase [Erysipelotrichales bacterium]
MRILFSAGGTGGHLYPALALADYINDVDSCEVLFVGSKYRIEATKVEQHGYDFIGLDIKTPSGNILRKTKGYVDVFTNIKKCEKIIDDFKPDIVIGFGGYTSYSIMKAAINKNIPTLLHEQNSKMGKSNHVLAKKVDAIISAYDITDQLSGVKVYQLGNPSSYQVQKVNKANLEDYGLSNEKKTVLVVMGSQGSQTVDEVMYSILKSLENIDFQLIYVSGENYYDRYKEEKFNSNIKVIGYENKLVSLIKSCDLIVSRSGASALSEIASSYKPAILVPSIHVTNNHQVLNSVALEKAEAIKVCHEDENLERELKTTILELIDNEKELETMSNNIKAFAYNDSAKDIYALINKIVGEKNGK